MSVLEENSWCPIINGSCRVQYCAWFTEGQCAFARLHNISDSLDEIRESIDSLEETISKKNFSE